jgi:predicted phage terminase large subunit-like protein
MPSLSEKRTLEQWRADMARWQQTTSEWIPLRETQEQQQQRIRKARRDFAFFVKTYFPDIARTPCGKFHIDAAKYVLAHPNTRAVFEWARGHAKSTQLGVFVPLWLKIQTTRQFHTLVYVSKSEDSARQLLSDLQQQLAYNELFLHDFGKQMKEGSWSEGEFETNDGSYFRAIGRGQSPRGLKNNGRRPDYIIIDDLDDDEMCRNPRRVEEATQWVLSALFGTMEAGRGRFIMVGNRIAQNTVLAKVIDRPGVFHTRVNILDKDGKPTWAENYQPEEIAEMRALMGERNFQQEYMNNPVVEGAVFLKKHIRYGQMLPLRQYVSLVAYTDPSFKNSPTADYKATMLVGRTKEGHFHVIRAYADQTSVSEMIAWHYDIMQFVAGTVPVRYFMEANFMQDLMLDEFRQTGDERGEHIPLLPDKRQKGDKFARIEAMQPLFERELILFNQQLRDTQGFRVLEEQLLMFQRGSRMHDDAPDALESAIWMLAKSARTNHATYRVVPKIDRRY